MGNLANGNIFLDLDGKNLFVDGVEIRQGGRRISRINFLLLKFFLENRGALLSKETIILAVWGKGYVDRDANLRTQMGVARRLIGDSQPFHIVVSEGYLGYRMVMLNDEERICAHCGQVRRVL